MHSSEQFFQTYGALKANHPSYILRGADSEILEALLKGEFCCIVMASRQTGKTSLMLRTMSKLSDNDIRSGHVDFSDLKEIDNLDYWFSGVIDQLRYSFKIKNNKWWIENKDIPPTRRFIRFLDTFILSNNINRKIVLFFDETESVPDSIKDNFFTTIRSLSSLKNTQDHFENLSVVFLGMALPVDFIKDKRSTPFNIGKVIELKDFEADQLLPFREVLGGNCEHIVDRIFYWTNGHPWMVQNLAEKCWMRLKTNDLTDYEIDEIVEDTFFSLDINRNIHLSYIESFLLNPIEQPYLTLETYLYIFSKGRIKFKENSRIHQRLLLSGIICLKNNYLTIKNLIYYNIFNKEWIKENLSNKPRNPLYKNPKFYIAIIFIIIIFTNIVQPKYFPSFINLSFQGNQSIFYSESSFLSVDFKINNKEIKLISVENLSTKSYDKFNLKSSDKFYIEFKDLVVGENLCRIRQYDDIFGNNYETQFKIIYFPKEKWKEPKIEMTKIEPGCFFMGCKSNIKDLCPETSKPYHEVCISDFYIGKYEVSQKEWEDVMGYNPSENTEWGDDAPVDSVSWNDVNIFIYRLNLLTNSDYRLPTEAEWEYASKDTVESRNIIFNDDTFNRLESELNSQISNYIENSINKFHSSKFKGSDIDKLYQEEIQKKLKESIAENKNKISTIDLGKLLIDKDPSALSGNAEYNIDNALEENGIEEGMIVRLLLENKNALLEEYRKSLTKVAWFADNSKQSTRIVGLLNANTKGIHDMVGNVSEWTNDRYDHQYYKNYLEITGKNPKGPSKGEQRVLRGCSYGNDASSCTTTRRTAEHPYYVEKHIGFRIAK